MIKNSEFWEKEKEAPLLNRNEGFIKPESTEELLQRAQRLLLLLEEKHGKDSIENISLKPDCDDEAAKRIFILDAERTFKSPQCRQQLVEGYFKAAPVAYVRDARVMQKLLDLRLPEVGIHLKELACAEAYASKWFVGLNVHVLTFEALFDFFEALIITGNTFLFKFALALIETCKDELLAAKNAAEVLEILRLDVVRYTNKHKAKNNNNEGSFFIQIVNDAKDIQIEEELIEKLREEAMEDLRLEEERRRQRDKELGLDSDDSIVFSDEEEEEEDDDGDASEEDSALAAAAEAAVKEGKSKSREDSPLEKRECAE